MKQDMIPCGEVVSRFYDTDIENWVHRTWSGREQALFASMAEGDLDGKRILHIGTGRGDMAKALNKLGCVVDSVSINEQEVANLRECARNNNLRGISTWVADKHDRAAYRGPYDSIVDVDLLCYSCCLGHAAQMLGYMRDALRPGGVILSEVATLRKRWIHMVLKSRDAMPELSVDDFSELCWGCSLKAEWYGNIVRINRVD